MPTGEPIFGVINRFLLGALVLSVPLLFSRSPTPPDPSQWATTTTGDHIYNVNSGKVGIGTSSPNTAMALSINGNLGLGSTDNYIMMGASAYQTSGGAIMLRSFGSAGRDFSVMNYSTALGWMFNLNVLGETGNIGIGTTVPTSKLTVYREVAGLTNVATFTNNVGSSGQGTTIRIATNLAGSDDWYATEIGSVLTGSSPSWRNPALVFRVQNQDTYLPVDVVERMRITSNGYVGIGTANPQARLSVAGDVLVTGNIAAKYQDIAEYVPADMPLEAGTVVITDPARPNHVVASSAAYDTRVAGVVTQNPGIVLGEAGDGKLMVATTGRVKVSVDAAYGQVQIGDLLVTSPTPGVAMRSEPMDVGGIKIHRPGTLLGKALETLSAGKREILVLLSLQ